MILYSIYVESCGVPETILAESEHQSVSSAIKTTNSNWIQMINQTHMYYSRGVRLIVIADARSHAIEMVFVFIATEHAGSSARSFMLS